MTDHSYHEQAQKYLLDPLTAPEPSQVHAQDLRTSQLEVQNKETKDRKAPAAVNTVESTSRGKSNFHPSNPYSPSHRSSKKSTRSPPPKIQVSRSPPAATNTRTAADPFSDHRATRPRSSSARSHSTNPNGGSESRHHPSGSGDQLPRRSVSTRGPETRGHQRNQSLPQRFPGDMSHRPLDVIKRETKAADRHPHNRPHRRHRSSVSQTDQIDALDTIGGSYHHGGPYDATLASRNLVDKYSPLAAVHDSNMEALRATPNEYIQDSLTKHVPLQGTAIIPSGGVDMSGNVVDYQEGSDLMRETDAPGGAYKRWEGIPYHPEDFKGKGEPSFTIERDRKKMKERDGLLSAEGIEMTTPNRQRSYSNGAAESSSLQVPGYQADSSGINRSNTTGKKLSEGLKKRFGSLKKKAHPTESVH